MRTNALQVRQSFGKILRKLQKSGDPIVIEKARKPVAVLISMQDFRERFIDKLEEEKRTELIRLVQTTATPSKINSLKVLRNLRYGSRH